MYRHYFNANAEEEIHMHAKCAVTKTRATLGATAVAGSRIRWMRTRHDHACNSSVPVIAAVFATSALAVHSTARAQSDYDVTINTSSLSGTEATLTFDFLAGGGTQSNRVTLSDFSTNGTLLSGGVNSGSVSGSLPGTAALTNAAFFDELQQGITLGSTITFQLDATRNAPSTGSLPDTFSFFILNRAASASLVNTTDPTGANSLFTLQIDGSSAGALGVYASMPAVPIRIASAVPEPATPLLFLGGLLGIGAVVMRGRSGSREALHLDSSWRVEFNKIAVLGE
jgi:hypothetical protein